MYGSPFSVIVGGHFNTQYSTVIKYNSAYVLWYAYVAYERDFLVHIRK